MSSFYFSKSKYCSLWQCPKITWLQKYKPEEREIDDATLARMREGDKVGDLAMGLFGDFVEVTAFKDDGSLDLGAMIAATKTEMDGGTRVICEASFSFEGLYCAVDILVRDGDGWSIYEVKSSTHNDKAVYMADIAYQRFVLERCGVQVIGTYLVCLDSDYVFDGTLDPNKLFLITDVNEAVEAEMRDVGPNLQSAERLLSSPEEPEIPLSPRCRDPYPCSFWRHCTKDLPSPSAFDLHRLHFPKALGFHREGLDSLEQLAGDRRIKKPIQLRQIDHAIHDREDHIDRPRIKGFLETLHYPLYFLDFETVQPVIPEYVGTRPYAQVPFQYSLHCIEKEGGPLEHKEYLADPFEDPRRPIAERLCEDIPVGACVTAYNKSFECSRLKELADQFPDLAEHLLAIRESIVDLLTPFQSGWYYNRAMGGSFSIKSVLPALFPDDPELNYANLEDVHNGSEAMNAFAEMRNMEPEERRRTRAALLEYCKLDTYAMVKLWQKLRAAADGEAISLQKSNE